MAGSDPKIKVLDRRKPRLVLDVDLGEHGIPHPYPLVEPVWYHAHHKVYQGVQAFINDPNDGTDFVKFRNNVADNTAYVGWARWPNGEVAVDWHHEGLHMEAAAAITIGHRLQDEGNKGIAADGSENGSVAVFVGEDPGRVWIYLGPANAVSVGQTLVRLGNGKAADDVASENDADSAQGPDR